MTPQTFPDARHAYVQDGIVVVMFDGRWQADTRLAWSIWLSASDSPIPATQERAREIRAALDEVQYLHERKAA